MLNLLVIKRQTQLVSIKKNTGAVSSASSEGFYSSTDALLVKLRSDAIGRDTRVST